MRRVLIIWSAAFALLVVAFVITVGVLASTVYSAGGFVGEYLGALARHDSSTARQLPGVLASEDAAADLLSDSALGELDNIELVSDETGRDGIHTVTYGYTLADNEPAESSYRVRQTGAFLGLFPTWTFDSSPLSTVAVTVLHDPRFRANGVQLSTADLTAESPGFLVFTPGLYTFDHDSTYLTADSIAAPIIEPGSVTAVQVNVQANEHLVEQVDEELRTYLDACVTQEVLLPTGCPFGKTFDNRIDSTPSWSMSTYPSVEVIPGTDSGSWLMPHTDAAAHLSVKVRSLFDGRITDFDEDVPFSVSYSIAIGQSDELAIQALDN